MKVYVTGATGFLGKAVVFKLKALGHHPFTIGRNRSIGQTFTDKQIPFISLDLTCRYEVLKNFEGADVVINCAGLSSVWGKKSEFHKANVDAVSNVIEACHLHQVRKLVHISTPSIYFNSQDRFNLTENSPLPDQFINDYASSKKEGEDLVQGAFEDGLSTTILRPRGIYGPGDTALFPRLLKAIEKKMLPLINEGNALMDITYVDNVVDAIILAMENNSITNGQAYNITNDDPKTFAYLMELLSAKMNIPFKGKHIPYWKAHAAASIMEMTYRLLRITKEPPLTCYSVGLLAKSMTFDISRAKNELGYRPQVSIEEGFDIFTSTLRKS